MLTAHNPAGALTDAAALHGDRWCIRSQCLQGHLKWRMKSPGEHTHALLIADGAQEGDQVPPEVQQVNVDLGLHPLKGPSQAAAVVQAHGRGCRALLHHLRSSFWGCQPAMTCQTPYCRESARSHVRTDFGFS